MSRTLLVMLLALALIAPGAFAEGSQEGAGEESVELDLWIPGSGENGEAYEAIIENFEERVPNATVSLRTIPWSEYFTVLNTSFAGGVGPDVYGTGFGQLGPLLANGHLLALDEYLQGWDGWDDVSQAMLDAGTSEGTLHAVLAPEVRVLAIRDDIFEEAGVDPSVSIDDPQELREIAEQVVQRDGDRIAVQGLDLKSGRSNEQEFFSFVGMMGQYQLWDDDLQPLLETPEAVAALEMMQSYFQDGLSTYADDLEMTDGLAAMGFQSSSEAIQLEDRFGGDITWQPIPGGQSVALGTFFTVSAYTEAPEVAVELFKEIMSPEGQMIILEKQGLLPTRASLQEEFVSLDDRNQVFFDGVQNAYVYGPINPYFFEFIDAVRPQIEEALYGMKSAEEALADAAAAYRAAIE